MKCVGHCNVKCHLLGGLEQKIMEILWASKDPLKPSDVLSLLEGKHAYTTIMTVLKRMADKGLLCRHQKGKVYFYSPIETKQVFASRCLDDLFNRLYGSYGHLVIERFQFVFKKSLP
jgi:predicted transcriptional regulator